MFLLIFNNPMLILLEMLFVPSNVKVVAIPLFELYDNSVKYGPQLASIPNVLSQYTFEYE